MAQLRRPSRLALGRTAGHRRPEDNASRQHQRQATRSEPALFSPWPAPTLPQLLQALVAAKGAADAKGWQDFQARVSGLKLTRSRALREAEEVAAALEQAQRREATAGEVDEYDAGDSFLGCIPALRAGWLADVWQPGTAAPYHPAMQQAPAGAETLGTYPTVPDPPSTLCVLRSLRAATAQWDEEEAGGTGQPTHRKGTLKIVLITGFESFNVDLYKKAAVQLARVCPAISLRVFSDRDIGACAWHGAGQGWAGGLWHVSALARVWQGGGSGSGRWSAG